MNSQDAADIRVIELERRRAEYERQQSLEAPIVSDGNAAEAFVRQPFWKRLVQDLTKERDKLLNVLKNPHVNTTKEQMRILQIRISDIELFIDSPMKYIESLRAFTKRKMQRR